MLNAEFSSKLKISGTTKHRKGPLATVVGRVGNSAWIQVKSATDQIGDSTV